MINSEVIVIIPAHNEGPAIGSTIDHLHRIGCTNIIAVDDGSTDDTASIAEGRGAQVIRMRENIGKGAALAAGFRAAPKNGAAYLLVDADLQSSAARLGPLVDAVTEGADVAIASFASGGGFGIAKGIASRGIKALTGVTLDSPLSGQRALSRRATTLLPSLPSGWGVEVGMTVRALRKGWDVLEIPIDITHAETRRDAAGFIHRGIQCVHIVQTLWALARSQSTEHRP